MRHRHHPQLDAASLSVLLLATLTLVLLNQTSPTVANINLLKNLDEIYESARTLESVHMQITEHRKSYAEKRYKALYAFAREPKGQHCDAYYGPVLQVISEYRIKAYQYVADNKKQSGWFGNFLKIMGPMGPMKGLSKPYPELAKVTERYESQSKSGLLQNVDVDCDLLKFHIQVLNKLMFVLQTDIKYLAIEQTQLLNKAIYHQLKNSDMVASHNFYEIQELTPEQSKLLRDFYLARVDTNSVKVDAALDHFVTPSSLIIGRLYDSCHTIVDYGNTWRELEPEREEKCALSKSDVKNDQFASEVRLSDYESTIEFCEPFLNSL